MPLRPAPAAPTIAILDHYQRQALNVADRGALPLGTAIVVFSEPARDAIGANIFAGSNEIQRNILAQQVLDLPS